MKQPKLMSPDAFSELEVCKNAFAAGALPRTPTLQAVVPGC